MTFGSFDDFNLDDYRGDFNRLENKEDNSKKFLKLPKEAGFLIVRFLPPPPGERLYCPTRLHYLNGRAFHCTRSLQNGKWRGECPICDEYNGLYDLSKRAKTEDEKNAYIQRARSIKPIERNYWNVIVRKWYDKEKQETLVNVGPLVIPMGKTLQQKALRGIFGDEQMGEPPLGNVAHPLKGRDFKIAITIKKSGNETFPDYGESKFLEPSPLGTEEQIEAWLKGLHSLRALREDELKSFDELQHQIDIFNGKVSDESTASAHMTREAVRNMQEEVPFEVDHRPTPQTSKTSPASPRLNVDDDDMSIAEDEFIREMQEALRK